MGSLLTGTLSFLAGVAFSLLCMFMLAKLC